MILPALKKGKVVLCDRFSDATLAYQGKARGLGFSLVQELNKIATGGLKPDLTILLDLDPRLGLKRARQRTLSRGGDRLENEGLQFQKKVRKGYLDVARENPRRVFKVAVQKNKGATQNLIQEIVFKKLRMKKGKKS